MKIQIRRVTEQTIDDLVGLCAPKMNDERHAQTLKEAGLRKKEWIQKALKRFGVCAEVAYLDDNPVAFVEFYPMSAFPLLPKRDKRTIMLTCVFLPDKSLQNKGIGSKLVQALIDDLRKASLPCFGVQKADEIAIGSWGCHTGFPDSLARFRSFFSKNGFTEDTTFPDPTGKGGILVHKL
jgi:GNAT superfamily N-acetyltransferase